MPRKKAPNQDNSPLAQLSRLPQPIGINGGSYTYWVSIGQEPLKFVASDGAELPVTTLDAIVPWMAKWAAKLLLEFLRGEETIEMLQEERILRTRHAGTEQAAHERDL